MPEPGPNAADLGEVAATLRLLAREDRAGEGRQRGTDLEVIAAEIDAIARRGADQSKAQRRALAIRCLRLKARQLRWAAWTGDRVISPKALNLAKEIEDALERTAGLLGTARVVTRSPEDSDSGAPPTPPSRHVAVQSAPGSAGIEPPPMAEAPRSTAPAPPRAPAAVVRDPRSLDSGKRRATAALLAATGNAPSPAGSPRRAAASAWVKPAGLPDAAARPSAASTQAPQPTERMTAEPPLAAPSVQGGQLPNIELSPASGPSRRAAGGKRRVAMVLAAGAIAGLAVAAWHEHRWVLPLAPSSTDATVTAPAATTSAQPPPLEVARLPPAPAAPPEQALPPPPPLDATAQPAPAPAAQAEPISQPPLEATAGPSAPAPRARPEQAPAREAPAREAPAASVAASPPSEAASAIRAPPPAASVSPPPPSAAQQPTTVAMPADAPAAGIARRHDGRSAAVTEPKPRRVTKTKEASRRQVAPPDSDGADDAPSRPPIDATDLPPLEQTAALPPAAAKGATDCAAYVADTSRAGRSEPVEGLACRDAEGRWQRISEMPRGAGPPP